jgi:amino acid transporter/mannitol/fructose-specific phosphotransferase system IIA component (Ntr-type)
MTKEKNQTQELDKGLGFLDLFCLATGAMISSGIFILPGLAFAETGPSVVVSYALAGMLALVGILSVAELATAMPKAGGDYYYVTRSLGPMVGTISGLLSWFALSLKTSFAIFGLSEVVHLLTGWPLLVIAAPICLLFTVLNIVGVKEAARLEVALVVGLLALMGVYVVFGVGHIESAHYVPMLPHGLNAMLSTAGFVFVSFGGLLNVATVAEEVKNPKRNIPLAFILSVVVITLAYAALLYVTVGVLPAERLSGSMSPLADAARLMTGQVGYVVLTIAALLAFVTTANAGIMSASRYPLALSRDQLLPGFFLNVNRRFKTPLTAVSVTGMVIFLTLLLDLELLVKAASTVVLTTYVLAGVAVIVLRHSGLQNYRPSFKVPGYPWVPALGIVLFSLLIIDMGMATIEISLGLVLTGLLIYVFYGRRRSEQEYALLHIIERITSKDLSSYSLESELKEIIHERDDSVQDRFDQAVLRATVLDVSERCVRADLFERIAEKLSGPVPLQPKGILDLLNKRESESSTALSDFVAVPHLVMPGENTFHVMLVRCRDGVTWSDDNPAVKAVFVICGTRDCRNQHLKALAAIAHIVQHADFERNWLQVRHEDQLRDILLVSERKR